MTIRPIHNDKDYDLSVQLADHLWEAPIGSCDYQHFEVLCELIENYERKRQPFDLPDPVESLQFYMNEKEISFSQLNTVLEEPGIGQKLLSRQTPFTVTMIYRLYEAYGLPPQSFLKPYKTQNLNEDKNV